MKERQRGLFIVEAMGGGVFTYIVDLANQLEREFDLYIAYAVRPQTPTDYSAYFDKNIQLIEVKNFSRSIGFARELKSICEIREIAKRVNPDFIHLHSTKAGVLGRWAFNGRKVPLYYTPHGYSFLMDNYGNFKRMLFREIEAICAKRNCTTISCSQGEHQETLKLTRRAMYINNGINSEKLEKMLADIEIRPHSFTVFTLGRICHQKNPKMFNEVAGLLPEVRFLWIGDGELREELSAPNIKVTGWEERGAALAMGSNADVFLLTSLWEGLPVSLLEAMYMKKPCVVSNVIGNHDVIHNGENGFVCNSAEEFKLAIQTVQGSQGRRGDVSHYVEAAFIDIHSKYNIKVMAKKYSAVFDKGKGKRK